MLMMRPGTTGSPPPNKDIAERPPGTAPFAEVGAMRRRAGTAPFWLAWATNALAAVVALVCLECALEVAGLATRNHAAVQIFLAGAACGALADLSARLVQREAHGRSNRAARISHELAIGLAIVFLAASIVCLVLGCASMTSGLLFVSPHS